MKQDQAEIVAIQVLGWLVGDDDLRDVFLGSSGASVDDLRSRASDPQFLGSVLEFLTMDDGNVMRCCDDLGIAYETPMQALQSIPGFGQVHWT